MKPTAERLPAAKEPRKEPASRVALTTGTLEKGKAYIQVGSYVNPRIAESRRTGLEKSYPTLVEQTRIKGKDVYRLFIGPFSLEQAKGLLPTLKQTPAYKGAFLRIGN
jgi:cell division septation protein DedD